MLDLFLQEKMNSIFLKVSKLPPLMSRLKKSHYLKLNSQNIISHQKKKYCYGSPMKNKLKRGGWGLQKWGFVVIFQGISWVAHWLLLIVSRY